MRLKSSVGRNFRPDFLAGMRFVLIFAANPNITIMIRRTVLYIIIMCLSAWVCPAAVPVEQLQVLTIREGLPGDCVYKVLKDSRGYVWVGTNNGLALYDGNRLVQIGCDARRSMNLVNDLVELPDGSMAVAMRQGLYRVEVPSLHAQRVCPQLTGINALTCLGDTLLVGSTSGLAWIGIPKGTSASEWISHPITLGTSRIARDNHILDFAKDAHTDDVWMIGVSALYRLQRNLNVERIGLNPEVTQSGLRSVCAVGGKVYVGTGGAGLMALSPLAHKEEGRVRPDSRLADRSIAGAGRVIADLQTDGDHTLYVASDGEGALELDTRTDSITVRFTAEDDGNGYLPTGSVYTFWRDRELDICWFGFFRQGFAHTLHVRPTVATYAFGEFDSRDHSIRSFCIHGRWKAIGTRDGLWIIDEQTGTTRHFGEAELGGRNVLCITWFGGRFVVATYDGGLCAVEPQTMRCRRPADASLRTGSYMRLGTYPDASRPILLALSNHLTLLDESLQILHTFTSRNSGLADELLTDFLVDATGKVWLSSSSGLRIYDPANEVVQRAGFPAGFFNQEPALLFGQQMDGDVLAVNENQLYCSRADLSAWDSIDLVRHLDVNTIAFIVPEHKRYWVGTNRGLFLTDSLFSRFRHFGFAEGLPSLFCNSQSWQQTADGAFWFSTSKGLHRVDGSSQLLPLRANEAETKSWATRLVFTHIALGRNILTPAECLAVAQDCRLPVSWNFASEAVELVPSLMDYSEADGKYLEWQLDNGEMRVTTERLPIRLQGLGMGNHTLRIYLPRSEEAVEYEVAVWPTWLFWFEVGFVILLLMTLVLLYQYHLRVKRYRILRRRKHRLDVEQAAILAVREHQRKEERRRVAEEETRRAAMYQKSRSSLEENRQLLRKVRQQMDDAHAYRETDLRVADVARAIGTTPNKISQMLSQYAQVSFNDFINDYRIEEFKRRALDDKYAHLSTLAIAEKCGFKKTTFYAAFARKEGCTPAEWLARQGKKR